MKKREIRDTLIKARNLISDPTRWTQNAYARDVFGRRVTSLYDAHSFAAATACSHVTTNYGGLKHVWSALENTKIVQESGEWGIIGFNDTREHSEVIEMFDQAIESLS